MSFVSSGYTMTPLIQQAQSIEAAASTGGASKDFGSTALGRMGQPEEVAATIVFLLGNESSFITGQPSAIIN